MLLPQWKAGPFYVAMLAAAAGLYFLDREPRLRGRFRPRAALRVVLPIQSPAALRRHVGLRRLLDVAAGTLVLVPRAVLPAHADFRRAQRRRRGRVLSVRARGRAGHVPDGRGQQRPDRAPRRGDGQRAVVRFGGHPSPSPQEQRSGAKIRRLRGRLRRGDALRHQPPGRRPRLRPIAHDGPPPRRVPQRRRGAGPLAGVDPRRIDAHGGAGVQAVRRAVPFLGAGRLRGGPGRGRRLLVRRLEGRRPGAAGPAGDALRRAR